MVFVSSSSPLTSLFLVSSFLFALTSSCFITNCPPGGKKRSEVGRVHYKQCSPCGPQGHGGRCFGPDLCCGPGVGCFRGTAESATCRRENLSLIPCKNDASACGAVERGQCVMEGYCCNEKGDCATDDICSAPSPVNPARFDTLATTADLRAYQQQQLAQQRLRAAASEGRRFLPFRGQSQQRRFLSLPINEDSDLRASDSSDSGRSLTEEILQNLAFAPRR